MAKSDDELLEHLDPETARRLFPERFPTSLTVTLVYPALDGDAGRRLAELAAEGDGTKAVEVDRTAADAEATTPDAHRASFTLDRLEQLHELYAFLEEHVDRRDVDILINGSSLPLTRELWLPLLWALRA